MYNPSMYTTLILPTGLSEMLPELSFTTGMMVLGLLSLGAGFADNKIALIVLRALSGIGMFLSCFSVNTIGLTQGFSRCSNHPLGLGPPHGRIPPEEGTSS